MSAPPSRPDRLGTIDGESARFAAHNIDPDARTITITTIQRGSRSLERLQRAMSGERITVTLPGDPHPYVTSPGSIDVTTSGAGEGAFHRARLELHLVDHEDRGAQSPGGLGGHHDDMAERLDRLEAKVDRLLSLLDPERSRRSRNDT